MSTMTYLISGVVLLLAVASIIGWAISRRVTSEVARETVRNLNARIKAWWVMVAIFAVAFIFGEGEDASGIRLPAGAPTAKTQDAPKPRTVAIMPATNGDSSKPRATPLAT